MNSFGNIYRLTSFGESHGPAMGGVIDGMPAGVMIGREDFDKFMARRSPGGRGVSPRREADRVEFLSGLMECDEDGNITGPLTDSSELMLTLGTPIGFTVRNTGAWPADYDRLRNVYRPSHADYAWQQKYGIRDWRGGGRSSGRETVSRVVAGALAAQALEGFEVEVSAKLVAVGDEMDPSCFASVLKAVSDARDSIGGVVECCVTGVPLGLGEPVFGKLQQMLASAVMSVGGVKCFEYGSGAVLSEMRGSEANDSMYAGDGGEVRFATNHSGGIQGGISNGEEIVFQAFFKPTPTIGLPQCTVDAAGHDVTLEADGRHDPCIAVRGAVVIEAMACMVLWDAMLMARAARY